MSALKFIQLVARKKAAQKGGEGITTIANKMRAEAKAGEIAETFRLSGLTPDKWAQFIKSEKDVLKYLVISLGSVTLEISTPIFFILIFN